MNVRTARSSTPHSNSSPRWAIPSSPSRPSPPAPGSASRRSTDGGPPRRPSCWTPSSTSASRPREAEAGSEEPYAFPDTGDLEADLKFVLRATVDELLSPTYDLPYRALAAEGIVNPEIAAEFVGRVLEPSLQLYVERLRAAQRAGQVAADLDPRIALELVTGPITARWLLRTLPLTHAYRPHRSLRGHRHPRRATPRCGSQPRAEAPRRAARTGVVIIRLGASVMIPSHPSRTIRSRCPAVYHGVRPHTGHAGGHGPPYVRVPGPVVHVQQIHDPRATARAVVAQSAGRTATAGPAVPSGGPAGHVRVVGVHDRPSGSGPGHGSCGPARAARPGPSSRPSAWCGRRAGPAPRPPSAAARASSRRAGRPRGEGVRCATGRRSGRSRARPGTSCGPASRRASRRSVPSRRERMSKSRTWASLRVRAVVSPVMLFSGTSRAPPRWAV